MLIRKRLALFILIFLTAFACYSQKKADTTIAVHYQTKDFDVAIFPLSYTYKYVTEIKVKRKRFTPSKQDIDRAEIALKTHIKELIDTTGIMIGGQYTVTHSNLAKYKRQYFGYSKKGHKILYINCFCGVENYWLIACIALNDGGSCFWHIQFDLDTGKLFGLSVNGTA